MWRPIRSAPAAGSGPRKALHRVRHLYIDIDTDGDARLAALRASESRAFADRDSLYIARQISGSMARRRLRLRSAGTDAQAARHRLRRRSCMHRSATACFASQVSSIASTIRLAELPSNIPDDSVWTPDDFRLDAGAVDAGLRIQAIPSRTPPSKHSNSENDWAWVCDQLAHGKDAVKLTRELASRRSDKPNPVYYAQRTVDVASARLWLIEGIRIDDVITMLESRRRFEIPAALCCGSCAGDCGHGRAHDCPQKDRLISTSKGEPNATA